MDPEYETWYRLLNCGIRLPASTGSDWFVCSSNRVYADVGSDFSYGAWLAALRAGRTFVTNGPVLQLTVAGHSPSTDVLALAGTRRDVMVTVEYEALHPIDRVEIVRDGTVVAATDVTDRSPAGRFTASVDAVGTGWLAARCWGRRRTSYGHPVWAHTSPVYLRARPDSRTVRAASQALVEEIARSEEWLRSRARYADAAQRTRMLQLFADGRAVFERLLRDG
jgi:hypothetical protein